MKLVLTGFKISILLIVFSSFQLFAQQQNSNSSLVLITKLELKILGTIQQSDVAKIDNALTGFPDKIISHDFGSDKNSLFVFISDKVDPVDILQVLKMNGIRACYRDGDNGYVSLEPDGKSTRKLYFKE